MSVTGECAVGRRPNNVKRSTTCAFTGRVLQEFLFTIHHYQSSDLQRKRGCCRLCWYLDLFLLQVRNGNLNDALLRWGVTQWVYFFSAMRWGSVDICTGYSEIVGSSISKNKISTLFVNKNCRSL